MCVAAAVAPILDLLGDVFPDAPADGHVNDVTADEPRDHEDAEHHVADPLEVQVLEDFCD